VAVHPPLQRIDVHTRQLIRPASTGVRCASATSIARSTATSCSA
jgi:hypothetical protein